MSDNIPSTSWAVWAWQAYRDGRLVDANAIPAAHAPTVKVKPLVWAQEGKRPEHAVSIVGTYLLVKDFDGWRWMRVVGRSLADICLDPFPSPEAAKSAAQADYDARILAAIEVTP